jgi:hypothetical protein
VPVPDNQGSSYRGWDGAGTAPDVERLGLALRDDPADGSVAGQASNGFGMQYLPVAGLGSSGSAPFENFEVDDHTQVRAFTSHSRRGTVVEVAAADVDEGVSAALRRYPPIIGTGGA